MGRVCQQPQERSLGHQLIAAYGTHSTITNAPTIEAKRDAAMLLVFGDMDIDGDGIVDSRQPTASILNATGTYVGARWAVSITSISDRRPAERLCRSAACSIDLQLAFEVQLKSPDGDRFYYLQRLDGLHLLSEMENNTFAKVISLNADAGHLPSDVFSTPGLILEVDQTKQWNPGLGQADPTGGSILTALVLRDNPATAGVETHYLRYTGTDHVLLGGTDQADTIIGSEGDDTIYGDAGNDRLEGGAGNDQYIGGDGDDIITDLFGDDIMRTGRGTTPLTPAGRRPDRRRRART